MTDEAQRKSGAVRPFVPDLEWLEGDVPRAEVFDDTYFSKAGGFEETRHVFLSGNGLPARFDTKKNFTIAEFGFGTGLNFLATLHALKDVVDPPKLTFVSFELYPMAAEHLVRALAVFPEITRLADELVEVWAPRQGWNSMTVAGSDLLLGIGDARQLINDLAVDEAIEGVASQIIYPVDAWYLDGFSPAKNPELWDLDLLTAASALTASDGTLATYTSAGWVRRNLQTAGFSIRKGKGFSGKREMVVGQKADTDTSRPAI